MFIVIDKRYREVARTPSATKAVELKEYFNTTPGFKVLQPFGISFLPERMLPEVLNVSPFPQRRR